MKTKFLLGVGLLISTFSFGQVSLPAAGSSFAAGNPGATNVYLGAFTGAGLSNTGINNIFVGYYSGSNNTTGYSNVFSGYESGLKNTVGGGNTFIGTRAGYSSELGSLNTYVGNACAKGNSGEHNSFLGNFCGIQSTGSYNVMMGTDAGYYSPGANSVILGYKAGQYIGSGSVIIGNGAGGADSGANKLYIANKNTPNPLIYGEFDTKNLKFNANKVGIGPDFGAFPAMTTIPNASSYRFFVKGGILAEEVRIRLQADWADYVFADDYKLLSLAATEQYINENGHLPNMPSAALVKEEGIEVGNIIKLQQEKIEELTLHLIEKEKMQMEQQKDINELKAQVQLLMNKK